MKRPMTRSVALGATSAFVLAAAFCAAVPSTFGQAAPAAPAANNAAIADDELIELDPFTVSADDETVGYAVKDTLAGTRIRTEMKDIASSLVVVNKKLMQDIGATGNTSLLQYTGNTEVGGVAGNFMGTYPTVSDSYGERANLTRPSNNTRVRGLDSADNTRDFFLTEIPWDSYNVDRVDIQRGPNSILFGVGSPAGIINSSVNSASFATAYKVETRLDNWGSLRGSFDVNQVLVDNMVSVRVAGLDERKKFEQDPAFENTKRIYAAVRFDPKLIANGRTSLKVNFENGDIEANRPRSLTPLDCITPWFQTWDMGSKDTAFDRENGFDPSTTSSISNASNANPYLKGIAVGRQYWPSVVGYYADANGNTPTKYYVPITSATRNGLGSDGQVDNGIAGLMWRRMYAIADFKNYSSTKGYAGSSYYNTKGLTDPSIFNFYEKLIDGDNKREWQKWNAMNAALSQTFFDDRLGLELVYDMQRYKEGSETIFDGGGAYAISIDVNKKLLDGSDNLNFGKIYVAGSTETGGQDVKIDRDGTRLTAFADLRSEDIMAKSWVTKVLGHHIITGLMSEDIKETVSRNYALSYATPEYANSTGESPAVGSHSGAYNWQVYLSDSLAKRTSAAGADASNINCTVDAAYNVPVRYFDTTWNRSRVPGSANYVAFDAPYTYTDSNGNVITNSTQSENPDNYVGWSDYDVTYKSVSRGDKESLMTASNMRRNKVKSKGVTWQGYMLDGNFVPVFGWRRDEVTMRRGDDVADTLGFVDGDYTYNPRNDRKSSGESKSWGGVLHMPLSWSQKLPGKTRFSVFYNRSSNFKADEPRQNVFGDHIANPTAKTKEYGFVVSTLEDRLSLKVNFYKTTMKDATLPYGSGFVYQQWALPSWWIAHVSRAQACNTGVITDTNWDYKEVSVGSGSSATVEDQTALLNAAIAAGKDYPLTQSFFNYYGNDLEKMTISDVNAGNFTSAWKEYNRGSDNVSPQINKSVSPVASCDTESKGVEFELTAQPLPNWNITVNVTKVEASYTAVSSEVPAYINAMTEFFKGPAGQIRMWGEGATNETFQHSWETNVVPCYETLKAYLGNSAPEIAPWRANLITTYTFESGFAKGFFIGGGYRWEDKKILGYGLDDTTHIVSAAKPLKGDSTDHYDLWIGYSRKLTDKINWRIQLNLKNIGEDHHLTAASLEPDGSWALARIEEGMTWQLSNTFSF